MGYIFKFCFALAVTFGLADRSFAGDGIYNAPIKDVLNFFVEKGLIDAYEIGPEVFGRLDLPSSVPASCDFPPPGSGYERYLIFRDANPHPIVREHEFRHMIHAHRGTNLLRDIHKEEVQTIMEQLKNQKLRQYWDDIIPETGQTHLQNLKRYFQENWKKTTPGSAETGWPKNWRDGDTRMNMEYQTAGCVKPPPKVSSCKLPKGATAVGRANPIIGAAVTAIAVASPVIDGEQTAGERANELMDTAFDAASDFRHSFDNDPIGTVINYTLVPAVEGVIGGVGLGLKKIVHPIDTWNELNDYSRYSYSYWTGGLPKSGLKPPAEKGFTDDDWHAYAHAQRELERINDDNAVITCDVSACSHLPTQEQLNQLSATGVYLGPNSMYMSREYCETTDRDNQYQSQQ